jgi:hypothetical protein
VTQVSAAEVGALKFRAAQVGAAKVGVAEVGASAMTVALQPETVEAKDFFEFFLGQFLFHIILLCFCPASGGA